MRNPQDPAPRRKASSKPAPLPTPAAAKRAHVLLSQETPHQELLRAVERTTTSGGSHLAAPRVPQTPPKRQRRAAALKAASRAHEYAATGLWPNDDDDACTVPITALSSPAVSAEHGGKVDSNQHQSDDSAEDEVWGPPFALGSHIPLLSRQMGESSSAAIGLLAMSLPEEEIVAASRRGSLLLDLPAPEPISLGPAGIDFGTAPAAALAHRSDLGGFEYALERAAWAKRHLPKDRSAQLTKLLSRAAMAYYSAIDAEGPVLETARLLANKQAVLTRTLLEAQRAAGDLERYIQQHSEGDVLAAKNRKACAKKGIAT